MSSKKSTTGKKSNKSVSKSKKSKASVISDVAKKEGKPIKKYQSFKLNKSIKHKYTDVKVPGFFGLARQTLNLIFRNKALLFGIAIIYGALYLLLVKGAGDFDIVELKELISGGQSSVDSWWAQNALLAGVVLGGGTKTAGEAADIIGFLMFLMFSMAYVWCFRHIYAGKVTTITETFYNGMYPMVPVFMLTMLFVIQLIPAYIGNFIFTNVLLAKITTTQLEMALVVLLFVSLLVLSGYMITNTVIAFYIVMLPGMTPAKALKSARKIVHHRRFLVARRIIQLLLFAFLVVGGTLFSIVVLKAEWAVYFVTASVILLLLFVHGYMYTLYRSLI